ncbi:sulfite exporter TauE/SafE family protein [Coralloluteibacterium thermophilus]|uniref:Sulfite exporter TauE/SafE family protein n=1 Tax=Coralloluteibacterium thermophilum TaxID=2707049 RepID=A0ABV9NL77_9GAMM
MAFPDTLGLFAAFLLGLFASGHCLAMCGGISAALGIATGRDAHGRTRLDLLVGYQLGRIASYALAGLLIGGLLGGLIAQLDAAPVRQTLRIGSAAALALAALVLLGRLRDPGARLGHRAWRRLAPLGRRLFPVNSLPKALAFGAIWGWMPCGFVYTVLLMASLSARPLQAAAVMLAFGLGTLPALLATGIGAQRALAWSQRPALRRSAGVALMACAALVLAGPWLGAQFPGLHAWLPADCL